MKRFLALVLALCMVFALAACGQAAAPAEPETKEAAPAEEVAAIEEAATPEEAAEEAFDVEAYGAASSEIYNEVLGEFYELLTAAKEAETLSERFTLMAQAEAKLLGAGTMIPLQSRGGNYAISRIAPRTVNSTLWGNDSDRYHQAIVVAGENFLTSEQVEAIREKWAELKGTGEYEAWVKEYLAGEGYTLSDEYNVSSSGDPKTWDVLATSRQADSEKIIQTYDGLYEYDIENVQQPALATSYEVSEDGLTYTFHLREGVVWVDSQGRKVADVKADDFVAGMQHMMDAMGGLEYLVGPDGAGIAGAAAYMNDETDDFTTVGVKAIDDYTLEYTLEKPCSFFMTMLGYSVFAPMSREYYSSQGGKFGADYDPEAGDYMYGKDPDHIAYCGPFVVTGYTPENSIVMKANESYWNADNINIHSQTWYYNDGTDALKAYNDAKAGILPGCGLTASSLEQAKADGLFDGHSYVSSTDATSFMGFFNLNREAFANAADASTVVSPKTEEQVEAARIAMSNVHFRRAVLMSLDRGAYNAQSVGEELKYANLINTYVPGTFVSLDEDVTVDVNGTETTFPAGTAYGAIVQAQLDADGIQAKVWDPEADGGAGSSSGFDGWYNPEAAKAELAVAVEELAAEGVEISAENPIYLDLPVFSGSETYANRGEALKQSVEAALDGVVIINKTDCPTSDDWYYAGYYTDYGYEANYDIYDVSGWGPDYGDPQTYLDTMLPDYAGYMVKCLGIF